MNDELAEIRLQLETIARRQKIGAVISIAAIVALLSTLLLTQESAGLSLRTKDAGGTITDRLMISKGINQSNAKFQNTNVWLAPAAAGTTAELRFTDTAGSNYVGFKAPSPIAANKIWTLPSADGSPGDALTTNGSGALSWTSVGGTGTVTNFSAGNLNPLLTTSVANPTTTPALTFSLSNANSYTVFGNNSGASAAPAYFSLTLASAMFQNQGTTTTVLHGNAAGNPSWSAVSLANDITGTLAIGSGGTGAITASTARSNLGVPGLSTANTFTTGLRLIQTGADATVGLAVRANSGTQSADLQQWQNSAGSSLASISSGGVFTGSGSGLTNLNATNLSSGTVPSARLSGTYSSALTFSSASNSFTGDGSGLSSLNASNISSGTLAVARGGTGASSLTGYGALVMNAGGTAATSVTGTSNGQVLKWNGTTWAAGTDDDSGSIWTDAGTYIYASTNSGASVYDEGQTYGIYYSGGNQYGMYGNTSSTTVGAAGVYGRYAPSTVGTGFGTGQVMAGVQGYNYYGTSYHFGVAGYCYDDQMSFPYGGVIGAATISANPAVWGALGYKTAGTTEWAGYFNGNAYVTGNVGIGESPGYKMDVAGDIYANGGWLRVSGNQGLYFESWGGGWYMSDGTWIRSYNGKYVYCDQLIRADGGFQVDGYQMISADASTVYCNQLNASGGGLWISDDGGLYDYNDGWIRFNGSLGFDIRPTNATDLSGIILGTSNYDREIRPSQADYGKIGNSTYYWWYMYAYDYYCVAAGAWWVDLYDDLACLDNMEARMLHDPKTGKTHLAIDAETLPPFLFEEDTAGRPASERMISTKRTVGLALKSIQQLHTESKEADRQLNSRLTRAERVVDEWGEAALTNGEATVMLPAEFTHLMGTSVTYFVQLTPIGNWVDLYVAERRGDRFIVRSSSASGNFTWRAEGTRAKDDDWFSRNDARFEQSKKEMKSIPRDSGFEADYQSRMHDYVARHPEVSAKSTVELKIDPPASRRLSSSSTGR